MRNNIKIGKPWCLALIAMAVILISPASTASGKDTYTFTSFTYPNFGDANRIDMIETLQRITTDASRKTGVTIKYMDYIYSDNFNEAFFKKELDFGFTTMERVYTLRNMGIELEPLVLGSMQKRPGSRVCVYVKKSFTDLKALAGAPVNLWGSGTFIGGYILTRKLLLDSGIDMPLYDFFGSIYKIPLWGSSFQALLLDKVDAVIEYDWNYEIFGKNLPGAKELKTLACTGEFPVIGIFMQQGLDKTVTDKLKAYFKTLNSSPILGKLRTIFLAMNLKFMDPDPAIMKRDSDVYAIAREKGWMKEADAFASQMNGISFGQALESAKKDYKQCKALCDKNADKAGCIDKCMGE